MPGPETEREPLDPLIPLVLDLAGLPAGAYRAVPMRRRLPACLQALKVDSLSAARPLLQRHPKKLMTAVSSLLIGVSEFFRDPDVFDALRSIIAGEIAMRQGPIRVWSAGCSNGAELYSVAILLAEAGLLGRSILVGTDCRPDAIQEARAGLYSLPCVQQIPVSLSQKYFKNTGRQWRVVEPLRRNTRWRVRNFLDSLEAGPWHIILWRNVAIYLESGPAAAMWESLTKALCPGGILIVGKAERPPQSAGLSYVSRSIYRLPLYANKHRSGAEQLAGTQRRVEGAE
jgi:chemotaxis protein methyltransferase CheR